MTPQQAQQFMDTHGDHIGILLLEDKLGEVAPEATMSATTTYLRRSSMTLTFPDGSAVTWSAEDKMPGPGPLGG
jgi:hypothetical protein